MEFAEKYHQQFGLILKSDSQLESSLKLVKNAFYLILEALLVLEIFKFQSLIFGHVEKVA